MSRLEICQVVFSEPSLSREILSFLLDGFNKRKDGPYLIRDFPVLVLLLINKRISEVVRERMNCSPCVSWREHYASNISLIEWSENYGATSTKTAIFVTMQLLRAMFKS